MWNPVSLKIVNLFSHEDSFIEFKNHQITTIYGVNKTDPGTQSNGSGKSSILECISLALLGEVLKDISKKDIVRNGEKTGSLTFILKNDILNQELKIEREINVSQSNNALIYINDQLNTQLKDLSPTETDKELLKILGISKDDLKNYFLISKESYESFFLSNDSSKKEIINRFSKADILDKVEPLLKTDIDLLDTEINKLVVKKNANLGILAHLEEELSKEKEESTIEKTRRETIEVLELNKSEAKKLCDELPDLIEAKEVEITAQNKIKEELEGYKTELDNALITAKEDCFNQEKLYGKQDAKQYDLEQKYKPKFSDIDKKIEEREDIFATIVKDLQEEESKNRISIELNISQVSDGIKDIEEELKQYQDGIKECDQIIGEIEKNLADKIICPKCNHSFIIRDETFDIASAKVRLKETEETKVEFISSKEEKEKEIQKWNEEISEYREVIKELDSILSSDIKKEKTSIKEDIEKFESERQAIKDKLSEELKDIIANKSLIENKINEYKKLITTLKNDISNQEVKIGVEQRKINTLVNELGNLDGKATYYINQINRCIEAIKAEREKVYPDPTKELKDKIENLKSIDTDLQNEITILETDKGSLLEWQTRFKQFKSFLANTSISAIEEMTNHFLNKMKTSLTVSISGYKELSNKKLKEQITCLVCRDGLNGESFAKFSGGEKAKVDLACILSMQKIINLASGSGGLNLLFIDEILESCDLLALTGVIKALSNLEQTILLISHVPDLASDNKIQIEKVNHISKIVIL